MWGLLSIRNRLKQAEKAVAQAELLQGITTELSKAATQQQVIEVAISHGIIACGAAATGVYLLDPENHSSIKLVGAQGIPASDQEFFGRIPVDSPYPVAEAFRTGRPVWTTPLEPRLRIHLKKRHMDEERDWAAFPLVIAGSIAGSVGYGFRKDPKKPEGPDRAQITAVIGQFALAMDRARLYDSEKDARAQLEKAVRARDEFLSIASHELKTPLTSLKLQAQMLNRMEKEGAADEVNLTRLKRFWEITGTQIDRLHSLIEDMLDISRIELGKLHLQPESTDVNSLVCDVTERIRPLLEDSGCTLKMDLLPAFSAVLDRYRFEQVLINLLTNAAKYGSRKPVEIRLLRLESELELIVRDQGIGIDPKDHARIFEKFERAIPSESISGLGLGLFISRTVVEAHGGSLQVASTVGLGSTFTVRLPLNLREST